jgi:hypothetical protein
MDGVSESVRHHEIARYLLDNYHPLADLKHHLVLIRNGEHESARPKTFAIPGSFAYSPCDWGFVLHFFRTAPVPSESGAVTVPFSTEMEGQLHATRLQLPKGSLARFHYLELDWESLQGDEFRITDSAHRLSDPRGWVAFKSVQTPEPVRYRVPVGSCIQWRGFTGENLFLDSQLGQKLVAARLVP